MAGFLPGEVRQGEGLWQQLHAGRDPTLGRAPLSGARRCVTRFYTDTLDVLSLAGPAKSKSIVKSARNPYVSGHVKLPIGGHGTAHWWPAELPTGGQQNCPLLFRPTAS